MNEFLDIITEAKSKLDRTDIHKRGYDIGRYEVLMDIFNLIQVTGQTCFNCNKLCMLEFGTFKCECGCSWDRSKLISDYVEANLASEYQIVPPFQTKTFKFNHDNINRKYDTSQM
jgi:hypothetical protein